MFSLLAQSKQTSQWRNRNVVYDREAKGDAFAVKPRDIMIYREEFSGAVIRSRLKYKSHHVRWRQWGGKRRGGKWHPPNLRGRTCRSDASSLYLIL